jgi:ADP-ribose pyrophosphatase
MSNLEEKTVSSETIYQGKIIDLKIDRVELPDGQFSQREIVKHPGAVAIIAVTKDNKIVLVSQYRKALERTLVEIPAGKLEKGEDPLDCARRELEEDTGYKPSHLEHVTSFYTSPGFADELIHLYYTVELEKGTQHTDQDEFVELMEVTLDEALEFIKSEEIYDAKTAFAIQYLQLRAR